LPAVRALAGSAPVGRPHFAQHLVDIGRVRDRRQAFRKFLGDGKAGDVRRHWAPLAAVTAWIRAAGGTAVLAHPAHYGLTMTRLRALLADFCAAGGDALEVVSGRQDAGTTARLAALAGEFGLLASCGSDFHGPAPHALEPGGAAPLPPACRPVWDSWS
ncbi:MAG TPA: phosphatase, partial [Woeseiaceae bacterium]|nr:phosphatase [Woeseiaceae bacterium]